MKISIMGVHCIRMIYSALVTCTLTLIFTGVVYCGEFRDYSLPSQKYQQYEPQGPIRIPRQTVEESRVSATKNKYRELEKTFESLSSDQRKTLIESFNEKVREAEARNDERKASYYRDLINILKKLP